MAKIPFLGDSSNPIGKSEIIGRALDRRELIFIHKDNQSIETTWDDFYDTRPDNLSVDRLGLGSINAKIVSQILIPAHKRASSQGEVFRGWAILQAEKILKKYKISPEPIFTPDEEKNLYHAGIDRSMATNNEQRREIAAFLWALYATNGKQHLLEAKNPTIIQKLVQHFIIFLERF